MNVFASGILKCIFSFALVIFLVSFFVSSESALAQSQLPNLTIDSFTQRSDGKFEVIIKNAGPGGYMYNSGGSNKLVASIMLRGPRAVGSIEKTYEGDIMLQPGEKLAPWIFEIHPQDIVANIAELSIDAGNRISESSEAVGSNFKRISVKMPDFTLSGGNPYFEGSVRRPVVFVTNLGSSDFERRPESAENSLKISWDWKDASGGTVSSGSTFVGGLNLASDSLIGYQVNAAGDPPVGAIQIALKIDGSGSYPEYNEGNNSTQLYVPISFFPTGSQQGGDIIIVDPVKIDSDRRVSVEILNQGTGPVRIPMTEIGMTYEYIGASGQVLTSTVTPVIAYSQNGGLLPGQKQQLTFRNPLSARTTRGTVTFDPKNIIEETKGNNSKDFTVSQPELSFGAVTWEPDRSALVEIRNSGSTAVFNEFSGNLKVQWRDSAGGIFNTGTSMALASMPEGRLAESSTYVYRVPGSFIPEKGGSYGDAKKMIVTIDVGTNTFLDSNTGNNIVSADVPEALADLQIKNLRIDGETLKFDIENIGASDFNGIVNATYTGVKNDGQIDFGQVVLPKRTTVSKQIDVNLGNKVSSIKVTLLPGENDSDESNNSISIFYGGGKILASEILEKFDDEKMLDSIASSINKEASKAGDLKEIREDVIGILPDNPLYFFKDLGRGFKSTITVDKEEKIDLVSEYASEKIIEVNALLEKGEIQKAVDHLDSYSNDIEKINNTLKDFGNNKETVVSVLSEDITKKILDHKYVIDRVEDKVKPDTVDEIIGHRKKILSNAGEILTNVKGEQNVRKVILSSSSREGSPFMGVQNLKTINTIEDITNDKMTAHILSEVKEKTKEKLGNNLSSLNSKNLQLLDAYIKDTDGDKVNTLQALDDVKHGSNKKEVSGVVLSIKNGVSKEFVNGLQSAQKADKKVPGVILDELSDGSIKDLRILTDLDSKDILIDESIKSIKKKSINKFSENTGMLNEVDKKILAQKITIEYADITQLKVVNDIKKENPDDKMAKDLDQSLDQEVKNKISKSKTNPTEYDEFLNGFAGGDVEDVALIEEFSDYYGDNFKRDLFRKQIEIIKEYYSSASEEEKALLAEFFAEDNELTDLYYEYDPSFDTWWEEYEEEDTSDDSDAETDDESEDINEEYSDEEPYDSGVETTSGCPDIYVPVCGKDELNYPNECEAKDNNTEVAYQGECSEESSIQTENENEDEEGSQDEEEVLGSKTKKLQLPDLWPFW